MPNTQTATAPQLTSRIVEMLYIPKYNMTGRKKSKFSLFSSAQNSLLNVPLFCRR